MRTERFSLRLAIGVISVTLIVSLPAAATGRIIAANDDWIWWSGRGFNAPSDGAQFAMNVAHWLVGSSGGSILAYGGWRGDPWPYLTHPGLAADELRDVMESAGYQWTADNTVTFDLQTLLNYDAVFIGVISDPTYPGTEDVIESVNDVLTAYVNAGGSVYVFSGGGAEYPWSWDFLETFGLDFDAANNNSLYGHIPVSSTHELFTGVDHLYHANGRCIIDLDPADPQNRIIVTDGSGRGLFAVYDPYCDIGPLVTNLNIEPAAIDTNASISATVDDSTTGGSTIQSAEYTIEGSAPYTMYASDGAFDNVVEDVFATVSPLSTPGVHEVCVTGRDAAGNDGEPECTLLAVYDPDDGFVTGGGWIWSPQGAYIDDVLREGKANFGFVSKYKKGATTPTGNTEFQFKAGDLDFHSSSYDWLVVTGSDYARFKGWGSINGEGGYCFMLWAGDNDPDTFRIRIWTEDEATGAETDVYDNASDQGIGGGSIVIHAK